MALRRLGRGVFAGGLVALMCSQAPQITAQAPAHLWHADYNMEWLGPRFEGDQIFDLAYDFKYTWRFGILNDPNGVLDSPTITVDTSLAGLQPMHPGNVSLNPAFPPYLWTGPQLAPAGQPGGGDSIFTALLSNLSVGSLYQLGYEATRSLPGGPIAPGATETRPFTVTITSRDETLTQLGVTVNFALVPPVQPPPLPGPVTASNLACASASGRVDPFGDGPAVSWHIGSASNYVPLQTGTTHTLSCTITLTNSATSPAEIAPNIVLSGQRTPPADEIDSTTRSLTTNPSIDPWDPLGDVQYDVTASGVMRAILTRHFTRTVVFQEYNRILDVAPPVTTAATQPPSPDGANGWFRVQTVGVSLSANDGNGGGVKNITYSLSGAQNQGATTVNGSVANTTISAAGVTTVTFFATDNAGNVEEPKSMTVRRDSIAPSSTVTRSPAPNASGWNNGPVTVTVDGTDATSGVAQICFTLFGSTVQPQACSPGTSASVVVTAAGNTNVSYFAIDAAGNAEPPRSVDVKIDTVAPVTNASVPTNPQGWVTVTGPVSVSLNASDATPPPSQFSGVSQIHYSINGVEQAPINGLSGSVPVTAEGTTTIGYWAEDRAGNVEAPKTITVKRDSIKPVSTATRTPPANANGWNNGPVTVTVDATDATSGVAKVCLTLFGAAPQPQTCTNGSSASVQVTAAGNTNVSYFAVDAAGNAEAPRSVNIQIDNLAPVTNALFPPANPHGWYTSNLTISLTASDTTSPGFSGVTMIHYSLNGVEQPPIMGLGGPFTIFSEGSTQVHYWAEDRAGNLETPKTFTVNIDKTLPNILVAPSIATTEGAPLVIPFTVSGQSGETVTSDCSLSSGVGVVTFSSGGCTYSAADGPASGVVRIRAEDGHGNVRTVFTTVSVFNVAPTITSVTGPEGPVRLGTSSTLTAAYTDPGAPETFTCTFNWQDGSAPISVSGGANGCTASHTYAAAGVYSVDVTVTDGDGGASTETFDYAVVYSPDAGSVTGGGSINGTDRGQFGFNAKYHGEELKGQTQFQVKDTNLSFNSSSYDWLVVFGGVAVYEGSGTVNGVGDYRFRVTMTDSKVSGSGADTFRIQIWDRTTDTLTYDSEPGADDFALPTRQLATGNIAIHK
jgi:hypothetical protein